MLSRYTLTRKLTPRQWDLLTYLLEQAFRDRPTVETFKAANAMAKICSALRMEELQLEIRKRKRE